jgi:citrate lyase subunit gamma (acyl carrier protein)
MKIDKTVMAGSLESNDVLITLRPAEREGIELILDSIVEKQFADKIREVVVTVLNEFGVESAYVYVQDRGALDFVLKARMETAILRAKEEV